MKTKPISGPVTIIGRGISSENQNGTSGVELLQREGLTPHRKGHFISECKPIKEGLPQ